MFPVLGTFVFVIVRAVQVARDVRENRKELSAPVHGCVLKPSGLPGVWECSDEQIEFVRLGRRKSAIDLLASPGNVKKFHAYQVGEVLVIPFK